MPDFFEKMEHDIRKLRNIQLKRQVSFILVVVVTMVMRSLSGDTLEQIITRGLVFGVASYIINTIWFEYEKLKMYGRLEKEM
jgi:hypothetical protein